MLTLSNISIYVENRPIIERFSAEVSAGKILAVMGPSGIGKSSLLGYLAGTLESSFQSQGDVILDGKSLNTLPAEKREIGLLQQSPLLFPHLDVVENIMFAMPAGGNKRQRHESALAALDSVGLKAHAGKMPDQLSGGQQARLALIRTLAAKPKALLLDEPFSKLDETLREEMRQLVSKSIIENNIPAIIVTHDKQDADAIAQDIRYLSVAP